MNLPFANRHNILNYWLNEELGSLGQSATSPVRVICISRTLGGWGIVVKFKEPERQVPQIID